MNFRNLIFTTVVSVLTAGSTVYFIKDNSKVDQMPEESAPVRFVSGYAAEAVPTDFTKAAENTVDAVVHVMNIIGDPNNGYSNPYEEFFWGIPHRYRNQPQVGSGSGVIITKDGYIVTNNHVIDKADRIEVTLNDQKKYTAELVGKDPLTDLALLKIDADDLPHIALSNSDNVRVGQWVLAIGNPFNLTSTVTAGIISALGRNINILGESGIESFIQTDAAVNPGNSGGALVNTNGDLVGINTAISTRTGSYEGYSFAVPSNIVKKVVEDILEYGIVQRAYLGINIRELNSREAERLGVEETEGIYVADFAPTGFAEESGMKRGDIIYRIDGKEIKTFADLRGYLASKRPGDQVTVYVKRDEKEEQISMKLSNSKGTTELKSYDENDVLARLNADFKPLSDNQKYKLGVKAGVVVENIGDGLLKRAGIRNGYIILRIQNKWIYDQDDIQEILNNSDRAVLMEVADNEGYVDYYAVKLK